MEIANSRVARKHYALTLIDLKFVFHEAAAQKTKLQELKQKLDGLVSAEVKCDDVFNHVYKVRGTSYCILYYRAGFLGRKLLRNTFCLICRKALLKKAKLTNNQKELC